jgi:predicted ArsR family transcriptional regulator
MTTSLTDPGPDNAIDGRRADVLRALRRAGQPCSAAEAATATGLHLNTARFHLDALVADGLAERRAEPRELPGRPRILYTAGGQVPGPRSYKLLAEMLTGLIAFLPDAGPVAVDAGKAWGRHLVERAAPSERVDGTEGITRLSRLLDAIGFQPEVAPTVKKETEIRLRHCPFREVAERHTDVVCAVHLGLMQGALDELHAPIQATSLEPLVTPDLCIARLRQATPAPS